MLRSLTKLLTEQVARALTGEPWKELKQRLLTQASKLPSSNYLDVEALEARLSELIQLRRELRLFLEVYRLEPAPAQEEPLRKRAAALAHHLTAIYRLEPGAVPELKELVASPGGEVSARA